MSENLTPSNAGESEAIDDQKPNEPSGGKPPVAFTQADVDRIVQDRLAQQAKNKFGDYDDLKIKAGESKTLEDRVAEMESRAHKAEQDALRATVAASHGISTKKGDNGDPSDADLFLTGTDEETLIAQALRLSGLESARKKQGNFAPKEGVPPVDSGESEDLREFAKKLFNKE